MSDSRDAEFMEEAINLAKKGLFSTSPNPRVGCVIVKNSKIIGKGYHSLAGGDHAEIVALRDAGSGVEGSSLYTTLEPCNSTGKTGPCTKKLIDARIKRVVVAMIDPNPRVNGAGITELKNAGIEVVLGVLEIQAINLNLGFIKRMKYGLPWVRAKMAISVDGKTALSSGNSKWITGSQAREDNHKWRARSCMVLTGIGTLSKDNPKLNVRSVETSRQPTKVLVDPNFQSNLSLDFFSSGKIIIFVLHDSNVDKTKEKNIKKNIDIVKIGKHPIHFGKVNLRLLLSELAKKECNELHLEAGASLSGSFMFDNLVDEWLIYSAPLFLENGLPTLKSENDYTNMGDISKWKFEEVTKLGEDLRMILRPKEFCASNFAKGF